MWFSKVWEGLKGLWEDMREAAAAASTGDKHVLSSPLNRRLFFSLLETEKKKIREMGSNKKKATEIEKLVVWGQVSSPLHHRKRPLPPTSSMRWPYNAPPLYNTVIL